MIFNSLVFLLFLPIVFFLYWFLFRNSLKLQNVLLLVSSYIFYGWWDYRFVFLLVFSTLLDYASGIKINSSKTLRKKKIWLWISIGINLMILGTFKYYNFFIDSFSSFLSSFGLNPNYWSLVVILPVGISFYTFHGLSYVLDIYNNKIKPAGSFIDYAVFVSFFPLLVAGPIERAAHLLPQIQSLRRFNPVKAIDGLKQILWGFFKKMVIADNCAEYADTIFNNPGMHNGSDVLIGSVFFAIQIYGDFSGYSDIALGTARLFGLELLQNFSFPYFSRDIAEFWRRWHISLTTWFRDYVYFPLGGSKGSMANKIRNTFIIFLLSGFWHGANWTFIIWGGLNAVLFLPLLIKNKNRTHINIVASGQIFPTLKEIIQMASTFILVVLCWIFFRSRNLGDALFFVSEIFSPGLFIAPVIHPKFLILAIIAFMTIEWVGRAHRYAIEGFGITWPRIFRWSFYGLLIFLIGILSNTRETPFIYFQF